MKILREQDPEAIKKYEHIRPAPAFGGGLRCFSRCPGTARTCTLATGHIGPHVAHTFRKKVMAVWDELAT